MATSEEVSAIFEGMATRFVPEKAQGVNATILFELSGDNGGTYWLKIADGACTTGQGAVDNPNLTVKAPADLWYDVAHGKANVMQAFMGGKLSVKGDMGLGMKLQSMFGL